MDLEKENNNPMENSEDTENTQEQYTGCDEDLSEEITDEEYEEMLSEIEEPEKNKSKVSFISGLKDKAVCKLLFLFAAIGFIFPFFTVSCDGEIYNAYSTTGISAFKDMSYNLGEWGDLAVSKQWILIAAFIVIVIGLLVTVFFKDEVRYIGGLVTSLISAACIGVFYYMMPTILSDSMNSFLTDLSKDVSSLYGTTIDLTDADTLTQMGLDMSGLKAVPAAGMFFVFALLIINAIYFIVQLSISGKNKAAAEMTLIEGEFPEDFDETEYNDGAPDGEEQETDGTASDIDDNTASVDAEQDDDKTKE